MEEGVVVVGAMHVQAALVGGENTFSRCSASCIFVREAVVVGVQCTWNLCQKGKYFDQHVHATVLYIYCYPADKLPILSCVGVQGKAWCTCLIHNNDVFKQKVHERAKRC